MQGSASAAGTFILSTIQLSEKIAKKYPVRAAELDVGEMWHVSGEPFSGHGQHGDARRKASQGCG
jgi:hypothetical protein